MDRGEAKRFLGVGWKFPIQADQATGRMRTVDYEEDIMEAVRIILLTRKGERMMQPEFGCSVGEYLYGGVDYTSLSQAAAAVRDALIRWEPRITSIEVEAHAENEDASALAIHVSYVVRATNNPFNLVYPYYLNEGSI